MEIRYSVQAETMLENMPDFPKEEFEAWFMKRFKIGSNNILEFLMHQNRQKDIAVRKKK